MPVLMTFWRCQCLVLALQFPLQLHPESRGQQLRMCCAARGWLQRPEVLCKGQLDPCQPGVQLMSTWLSKLHAAPHAVGLPCAMAEKKKPALCRTAHAVEPSSSLQLPPAQQS